MYVIRLTYRCGRGPSPPGSSPGQAVTLSLVPEPVEGEGEGIKGKSLQSSTGLKRVTSKPLTTPGAWNISTAFATSMNDRLR